MMVFINATLALKFDFNHNTTYNLSQLQLSRIMNYTKTLFNNINDSFTVNYVQESDWSCGGTLKDLATLYANEYHFYLSIVICLFGSVANILNIMVLTRKDMASAPINRILTALAVADMVLMMEYIPFACYHHLMVRSKKFPYWGAVFMLFHQHVTQVLHMVSICLTLTLAIWRYLAIGYSERNHILCSESRCRLAIMLSYFLPIILCTPTYFTVKITSIQIHEDDTFDVLYVLDLNEIFQKDKSLLQINFWIYAVFIKLLPCCILTVISCWLIKTLFRAKKRKQVLRGYDTYPLNDDKDKKKVTKAERRADRTTKMLVAVLLLFLLTEFPQGLFAFFIGLKGKDLFSECYQHYGAIWDMLALLNGSINFILYCCMNRMFRTSFGQLFKYKLLARWAPSPPSDNVHTTPGTSATNTSELL